MRLVTAVTTPSLTASCVTITGGVPGNSGSLSRAEDGGSGTGSGIRAGGKSISVHMLRDRNLLQGVTQGEVIQVFERKAAEENVMDVTWGLLGCVGNGDTEFWVTGDQGAVDGTRLGCGPDKGREVLGGLGWGLGWGSQEAGWEVSTPCQV